MMTTINASHIFYHFSPKLHHAIRSLPVQQRYAAVKSHQQKFIDNEYIPPSAIYNNMYEESRSIQNDDLIDWEELVDEEAARRLLAASEANDDMEFLSSLDRETRKPKNRVLSNNINDVKVDKVSERNENFNKEAPWPVDTATYRAERLQSAQTVVNLQRNKQRSDVIFLAIVGTSTVVGIVGLLAAVIFWYRVQKRAQATLDADYSSYGISGPGGNKNLPKSTISDRKLAQSAQMFHYQQQRQQMMAQEKTQFDTKQVHSDESDDEAPGGGDYTVYECPGLAPTGEMEVRNPLFAEPDPSVTATTVTSYPMVNNQYPQLSSSPPKEKSSP